MQYLQSIYNIYVRFYNINIEFSEFVYICINIDFLIYIHYIQ